jgi:DNA-directed RNA polymerase subunit RPC12/RpoP
MPHRDDLEAAHARISALERELASAKKQDRNRFRCGGCGGAFGPADLDKAAGELRCRSCSARLSLAPRPRARKVPKDVEVDDAPTRLRISWQWRVDAREAFGFIVLLALLVAVFASGNAGEPKAVVALMLLVPFALALALRLAQQLRNRTVIEVTGDSLEISTGPISIDPSRTLSRREIDQLFCVALHTRYGAIYQLHAELKGGKRQRLVDEIDDVERAFFLEQAIERRLGIEDHPVDGEVPRRPRDGAGQAPTAGG